MKTRACAVWIACGLAVGYGRLRLGAHYLSDVLFSAGTAVLMAPISIALGDRYLALFDRVTGSPSRE